MTHTWNPVLGCNGVGCAVKDACWARAQAKRRQHACADCYAFKPHFHEERLHQPSQLKKAARIGVCFMGDLFDGDVEPEWQKRIFDEMLACRQHTFFVLTKQPQSIHCFSIPNAFFGVTVNSQKDLHRISELINHTSDEQRRFVSFEPLYEDLMGVDLTGIEMIAVGAQTRPNIQPEKAWVEHLITEASRSGTKVVLKKNLTVVKP